MIRQVGEHRAVERGPHEPERFAYATLDALSEHIAVLDERGTVVAVNRAWREFAGANSLSPEGLSEGANYFAACERATDQDAGEAARFAAGLRAVIGGELDEFSLEYPCHSPTRKRWFIARAVSFEFDGEVRAVVTHADITTRRLAEETTLFRSHLLDTVEQAVIATDLSGTIIYWNRFAEKLYGWPAADIAGRNVIEVAPSQAVRKQASEIMSRLSAGQSWSGEFTVRRRDGTTFRALISDTPIYDDEGAVVGIVGVSSDITGRKRAEEKLRESEERLRAIFEASRDGLLVEDDERIAYANNSYARLFGYEKPEELIGKHVSTVTSPDDGERMQEYGRRRLRGEPAPAAYEFSGRRKDGTLIDLEASVSTHMVAGKAYITTAVRDISERKYAEEALRQSESKYRLLMEQASDGIHTYDPQGNFIETNSKLCEMLGYTREELLGLNVKDLVPAEDLAAAPIRFDRLRAGQTVLAERRLLRKDGTLLPVEISGRMIRDGVLQSIIRDISERKRAEEELYKAYDELEGRVEERTAELSRTNERLKGEIAERLRAEETLRENEQRLKIALQTGKLGSWQLDLTTLELDSSGTCKANFGIPEHADFSYQDLFEAIHPEDREMVREAIERAVAGRDDYNAEYRVVWPDGDTHWIIARGRGIYGPGGTPLRMVGVTIDITERRQAEDARKELLRRLVAAQEEERRRISRELHDQLGQRLTALLMGLKTLSADSHGRRSALDGLLKLQGLADELTRELHTLAWGLRPPALDDLGLHTALYNYVEEWAEQARAAVDFHTTGIDGRRLPLDIETALYRITQEALTNVLKHAGAARVSIVLERLGEHVVAVIEDDGAGFDAEALLRPPVKRRKLGLLGMRERASMLGGTLNIESTPGAGTSVFVRIPLKPGGEKQTGAPRE